MRRVFIVGMLIKVEGAVVVIDDIRNTVLICSVDDEGHTVEVDETNELIELIDEVTIP